MQCCSVPFECMCTCERVEPQCKLLMGVFLAPAKRNVRCGCQRCPTQSSSAFSGTSMATTGCLTNTQSSLLYRRLQVYVQVCHSVFTLQENNVISWKDFTHCSSQAEIKAQIYVFRFYSDYATISCQQDIPIQKNMLCLFFLFFDVSALLCSMVCRVFQIQPWKEKLPVYLNKDCI